MYCDFCKSTNVTHSLPVKTFVDSTGVRSVGNWAACPKCAELIANDEWDKLTHRSIHSPDFITDGLESLVEPYVRYLHKTVRENIIGPIRKL